MDAAHAPNEMQPTNLEASVAVLAVEVRYARAGIEELIKQQQTHVTRNEWEQRNSYVDGRFSEFGKELAARRAPWTSIGAFVVAGAVLLLQLIERFSV